MYFIDTRLTEMGIKNFIDTILQAGPPALQDLQLSSPTPGLDQLEPTKYSHHKSETFPNP